MKLYCVVPFYNEEKYLPICLTALSEQTDTDFVLVLVNNASTDGSVKAVKRILKNSVLKDWVIVDEPAKGTGSAADTGFAYAIQQGATHIIRTDSDCAVAPDWIAQAKQLPTTEELLVLGKLSYQNEDNLARWYDVILFHAAATICQLYGLLFWRGSKYKTPFVMGAGNNMLISSGLYKKSGGFPRIALEIKDDDVELFDKVRQLTPNIYKNKVMKSNPSLRRIRKHGYLKTMLYYWNRKYTPKVVDVR